MERGPHGAVPNGYDPRAVQSPRPQPDVDQGEAEQGAAALVLIVPAGVVVVDDGRAAGGGAVRSLAGHQIVQAHIEVPGQGGQVVHVGPGGAGLPFLDGLAGDAQQAGKPLLAQTGLLSHLIEPLLKIHGKDLLFASVRGHTGTGPHPFAGRRIAKRAFNANQKWDTI